ncbi:basic leucine zipper 23-like [Magnolia sinica]|uniref:basic leucine zipper 23-like n=1 Tax=Magnolia sinica TaxID=86752 RepID=UPI0026580914|nr:basic leucine zipper 23-like [Magnolia sinica]XP_058107303.1 basic leucine zipper 23-like [Magnolia sinica]XP_058107304.1 basic leucine zipper 23-like [Magnolia sinica]
MDDGEVELSEHGLLPNPNIHESTPVDSFLDDFLKNTQTCTHTHTCNPPGPDAAHTHTCYHTHTRVISSGDDDGPSEKQQSVLKSRKPSGNREAVRKYREKKKAHTAYLEEEVKKLRLLNQQLLRKLQGQAMLEAEVIRLRTLLLDVRGKIDAELGVFPFQKQCNGSSFKERDCSLQSIDAGASLQCGTDVPCLHPQMGMSSSLAGIGGNGKMFNWEGSCEPAIVDCRDNPNGVMGQDVVNAEARLDCMMPTSMDMMGSLVSSASPDE